MPELPEVEIAARRLRERLPGRRVVGLEVPDPRVLRGGTVDEWQARLSGRRWRGVRRLAKFLLLDLEEGLTVIAHLRMTGKLAVADRPSGQYLRFAAALDDGSLLCFHDPRRLGELWCVDGARLEAPPMLARLGPDALEEPSPAERLAALGARSKRTLKAWLMDQTILGGLGNICAGEILFRLGMNPSRPVAELTPEEWERLAAAIPEYLRWSIAAQAQGSIQYLGERDARNPFALYRRAGEPCPRCGSPIRRVVIAGRGTYVCHRCQSD
jgi:formamidopyrimidine-DNA glycosylase